MKEAKSDIEAGLEAWMITLRDFLGDNILYAYAKGSATKKWDSPIDYVPIISDLDIHIMMNENIGLFQLSSQSFDQSMACSEKYENTFNKIRPKHLHIPRSQVMSISTLTEVLEYVPPRRQDVRMLFGDLNNAIYPSDERIKQIDLKQILDLEEFLLRIPHRTLDRTGIDFWSLIREMTFRVSPGPVRLLTQSSDNPLEVWSWNRTRVIDELKDKGYNSIADHYRDFYQHGWNLFLSGFTNSDDYRGTVRGGYFTLRECLEEAKKLA